MSIVPTYSYRYIDAHGRARTGTIPADRAATETDRVRYVEWLVRTEFLVPLRRTRPSRQRRTEGEYRLYQPRWHFRFLDATGHVRKEEIPASHATTAEGRAEYVRSFLMAVA